MSSSKFEIADLCRGIQNSLPIDPEVLAAGVDVLQGYISDIAPGHKVNRKKLEDEAADVYRNIEFSLVVAYLEGRIVLAQPAEGDEPELQARISEFVRASGVDLHGDLLCSVVLIDAQCDGEPEELGGSEDLYAHDFIALKVYAEMKARSVVPHQGESRRAVSSMR